MAGQSRPTLEIVFGLWLATLAVAGAYFAFTGEIPLGSVWTKYVGSTVLDKELAPLGRWWDDFIYGKSTLELVVELGGPPTLLVLILALRHRDP